MTETARFRRRPAAAKLPVSTTARKTRSWSKVGVPGLAISIPSNVSADFIRLIDDVESAYLSRIGTEEDRMQTSAITDPTLS
jgi:hypothetical protein